MGRPDLDVVDPIERSLGFEGDMKARDGLVAGMSKRASEFGWLFVRPL